MKGAYAAIFNGDRREASKARKQCTQNIQLYDHGGRNQPALAQSTGA